MPWSTVVEQLDRGDAQACARVAALIQSLLARRGAFDLYEKWEDITQTVIANLIWSIRRGNVRDPAAFVGYCAVATRRELARHFTGGRPETREGTEVDSLCDPGSGAEVLELRLELERGLAALPYPLRQILEASYLQGLRCAEAARSLGLSLGTFKRRKAEALALLRRKMQSARG